MTGRLDLTPRSEWQPVPRERRTEPVEHRCGQCWTAYGKSAIRCVNEPKTDTKEVSDGQQ